MQADVKGCNLPTIHSPRGLDHIRKIFYSTALLVARRSTLRQVGLFPPVGLRVVIFYPFGKDCRYPDKSAAESTRKNHAAVMCAEAKFSKINQLTQFKKPAGRDEGETSGEQARRRISHGESVYKFPGGWHRKAERICLKRVP